MPVGAVLELEDGRILFEYDDSFRGRGLEISPIHLPTTLKGSVSFEELRGKAAFNGLPGVLADSLPDSFGNSVIRAYFEARGETDRAFSPVQRLLYVGERAMGALTFHPAMDLPLRPAEQESLEVAKLVQDARRIVAGETDVTIPEIYRIGSSAGGMRPKAVVLFNAAAGEIRSGHADPAPGDIPCLLKFDGVGDGASADKLGVPLPYNRVEAAYADLARSAGLAVSRIELLEHEGYAHLLVHRFDIDGKERIHQHSFGGLIHVSYQERGASSYEEYMRSILGLGMGHHALREAYRRMVFNVLAVNQGDHVKNLSFHMRPNGVWELAPAYDVTFARGRDWTSQHQMRIQDKMADIREADLLRVAELFDIKKPDRILARVRDALAGWEDAAARYAVPPSAVEAVRAALEERAAALAG
jgi:serine/threonine-protein kinase HipA